MSRISYYLILFFAFVAPGMLCAQVKFYSTVSPQKIGKNEYTTLRIVVENSGEISGLKLPAFDGFKVVSGPNQESGMSSVNGKVSQHIAFSYILQPTSIGKKTIGAASANIAGVEMRTNTLRLEVTANASANNNTVDPFAITNPFEEMMEPAQPQYEENVLRKGETVQDKVAKNMQLRLEPGKTSVYVGEPILATYKLYSRLRSESQISANPAFNGFSVVEMADSYSSQPQEGTLNGRGCNVYTIRKAQLYALQPGNYSLDALSLENIVGFIKPNSNGGTDIFGRPVGQLENEKFVISSKPVSISVKPLPEQGKPVAFSGAVGKFSIDASLAKTTFTTDESGLLNLVISGKGNLSLLVPPTITWPEGVEAFDPKMTENFQKNAVPLEGSITYQYPLVVNKEGVYNLPEITFYFFNPATGEYEPAVSKPINFTVTKGSGKRKMPIVNGTTIAAVSKNAFYNKVFNNRSVLVSIVAFILLTVLFIYIKKGRKTSEKENVAERAPEPETIVNQEAVLHNLDPLKETEACLEDASCKDFYPLLNKELKQFLGQKFDLAPQDVHYRKIAWLLDKKGVDNTLILQLEKTLEHIEWQVYTPQAGDSGQKEFFAEVDSLIKKINECC